MIYETLSQQEGTPAHAAGGPFLCWHHFRVCGGTIILPRRTTSSTGLSPRLRGHHAHDIILTYEIRSIPASAGAPDIGSTSSKTPEVYPRVCGGTQRLVRSGAGFRGLSPRLRGHRAARKIRSRFSGSIPASAGAPGIKVRGSSSAEVYPRVCGGTNFCILDVGLDVGLSPRLRGHLFPTVL